MSKFTKVFFKKLKLFHNIHLKHKYLIKKKSYSMEGEDLVLMKILKDIDSGFFIDAGCYHPLHLNNTFLLYKKGWRGINIDVSKYSIDLFNYLRPLDTNINSAVTHTDGKTTVYYQKRLSQLTTVKKDISLKRMQGEIKEKTINAYSLNTILKNNNFSNKKIDFLNIDLEGADYEAISSLNFELYKPKTICIEITEKNITESRIFKFLRNFNYKKIWSSKSNISHIFVDN